MELKGRDIIIFMLGVASAFVIVLVGELFNSERCINCRKLCNDSAIYCSKCGQQLRIIDKLKEK